MGWKIYFFLLLVISILQTAGFVIARMTHPGALLDMVSVIFNLGILLVGPVVVFLYAFKKRFLNKTIWHCVFAFFVLGNAYAIYYLVVVIAQRSPNHTIPWVLVALQAIYIPLLVASHKYARQFTEQG